MAAAATTRGVPLGAHLRAKLLSNLDSRTIGGAPVEAMLVVPYVVNGNVILPARTMVYGRGSATGSRFTIAFTRMRLPDHAEIGVDGIALDDTDRKAGFVAARRLEPTSSEGPGVGAQVAKGTANTLLGTVRGGLGQDIVRDAGREVVNGHGSVAPSSGSSAILLDAPVNFEIFVNHAF